MPQLDRVRVGLIGYGVGKLYAEAFRAVRSYYAGFPPIDLVAVATATESSGQAAAAHFGFERSTTDYRAVLAAEDVNTLVLAAPNDLHHEMLIEALQTDRAIYADKPLTVTLDEARDVLDVARRAGRDAQMIFEFRYCPALQQAHAWLESGRLGRVYTCRITYYRSSYRDPNKPLRWKVHRGAGVLHDYAPHPIDLMIWLCGIPERVTAQLRTFIDERPAAQGSAARVAVDSDDHAVLLCALPGGALGTVEVGRLIAGTSNDLTVEVYGSEGSLRWSLMDPNYLYLADPAVAASEGGWMQVPTIQRYPDAVLPGADVPLGMMRFHIASVADFLRRTLADRAYDPGLAEGARVQAVIDAAERSAQAAGAWMDVPAV
jgi:predicted dehydrogenase